MSAELFQLSATALSGLYRQGALSPVEVARLTLERAAQLNPVYNAFILIADEEKLLHEARASERRWTAGEALGPLDGVPVSIKDDINVKGWPTREGSLVTSDVPAAEDAPPVARLRAAGALFLGKTNLPEFGHKGVTDSKLAGITCNPWDPNKTSGGSSGGAAVAAATRMGWAHLGGDGGGSIRIPASFCGVFGFKPTQGLIPRQPQNLFSTLATAGPLARTVADATVMLDVIAQPDPRDGSALSYERPGFADNLDRIPKGLKIAYAPTINGTVLQPDVAVAVAGVRGNLDALGRVEEIALDIPHLVETFNRHWMAVAAWLVAQFSASQQAELDPQLRDWAARGAALPLNEYLDAELERLRLIDQMKALFNTYDLLVLPTMAITAFATNQNDAPGPDGMPWADWTPFTYVANLAKLPAASLPCGLAENGLPVGLQVMGGFMQDLTVLQAARALEQAISFQDWLARQ